jgi:hypothetical protein
MYWLMKAIQMVINIKPVVSRRSIDTITMSTKQERYEEREQRLRAQARVWDNQLRKIANHKHEAYDSMLQDFVNNISHKVSSLRRKADECRHKSIWL